MVKKQKHRSINMDDFKSDLRNQLRNQNLNKDSADMSLPLEKYNSISKVLDKFAPLKEFSITKRKPTLWSTSDITAEKSSKVNLEKKWKQDKDDYEATRNKYNTLLTKLRTDQIEHIT